jgi:hypothetical protein
VADSADDLQRPRPRRARRRLHGVPPGQSLDGRLQVLRRSFDRSRGLHGLKEGLIVCQCIFWSEAVVAKFGDLSTHVRSDPLEGQIFSAGHSDKRDPLIEAFSIFGLVSSLLLFECTFRAMEVWYMFVVLFAVMLESESQFLAVPVELRADRITVLRERMPREVLFECFAYDDFS